MLSRFSLFKILSFLGKIIWLLIILDKLGHLQGILNCMLIKNPSSEEMDTLTQEAHICLAIANSPTGVKLKLINTLFQSRFCISNSNTIKGSELAQGVYLLKDGKNNAKWIDQLFEQTFTEIELCRRKELLALYDNTKNAKLLIEQLFN